MLTLSLRSLCHGVTKAGVLCCSEILWLIPWCPESCLSSCVLLVQEEGYVTADVAEKNSLHQLKLSGTKFRQLLRSGADIPEWFAFKSVVDVLREATPSK